MTGVRYIGSAALALTVGGCNGADVSDLESFINNSTSSSVAATPLPTVHGETGFEYAAMTERSPFEPFAKVAGAGTSQAPDSTRSPQPQELFPLGQLEMVGTLAGRGTILALIRDPVGITHPLAVGDYLGRDHGRITAIRGSGIDILELVEDGQGGWTARARTLELNEPHGAEDGPVGIDHGGSEQ